MAYLSVVNFWKYQNADVWKKSKTHPPWFKHYVHRDRELDRLDPVARLLFWELLAAATRYSNVLEADLNWLWAETRVDPEQIAEALPKLLKGGWLSQTQSRRRSRGSSRHPLEGSRDLDVDKEEEEEEEREEKKNKPLRRSAAQVNGPRPADEIWDALETLFGHVEAKTNAHARRNKATADLKRQHATCQDLQIAATKWPSLYPQATLTDIALATHFSQLLLATGRKPGQPQPVVCPDCGLGGNHHLDTCQRKDAHAHNAFA